MQYIERMANEHGYGGVRLRVFKDNPAKSLYDRLGYTVVESDEVLCLMEKKIKSIDDKAI